MSKIWEIASNDLKIESLDVKFFETVVKQDVKNIILFCFDFTIPHRLEYVRYSQNSFAHLF